MFKSIFIFRTLTPNVLCTWIWLEFTGSMGSKLCKVSPKRSLLGLFMFVWECDLRIFVEPSKSDKPDLDSLGWKNSKTKYLAHNSAYNNDLVFLVLVYLSGFFLTKLWWLNWLLIIKFIHKHVQLKHSRQKMEIKRNMEVWNQRFLKIFLHSTDSSGAALRNFFKNRWF